MSQTIVNGQQAAPGTAYAVVASGIITAESDIVTLKDASGKTVPVVVAVFESIAKADKYKMRLAAKLRKILHFNRPDVLKATPIYGVMQVTTAPKAPRKPMSEERKAHLAAALKAGRKRAKGPTAA